MHEGDPRLSCGKAVSISFNVEMKIDPEDHVNPHNRNRALYTAHSMVQRLFLDLQHISRGSIKVNVENIIAKYEVAEEFEITRGGELMSKKPK